ncbi:hypothetical protein [Paenibacillus lautus]
MNGKVSRIAERIREVKGENAADEQTGAVDFVQSDYPNEKYFSRYSAK